MVACFEIRSRGVFGASLVDAKIDNFIYFVRLGLLFFLLLTASEAECTAAFEVPVMNNLDRRNHHDYDEEVYRDQDGCKYAESPDWPDVR